MIRQVTCPVAVCDGGDPDRDGHPTPLMTDPDCKMVAEWTAELAEHMSSAHSLVVECIKDDKAKLEAEARKIRVRPRLPG